jgi:hypothetical protein
VEGAGGAWRRNRCLRTARAGQGTEPDPAALGRSRNRRPGMAGHRPGAELDQAAAVGAWLRNWHLGTAGRGPGNQAGPGGGRRCEVAGLWLLVPALEGGGRQWLIHF